MPRTTLLGEPIESKLTKLEKKPVFASIYDGGANEDFGIMSIYTAAGATV